MKKLSKLILFCVTTCAMLVATSHNRAQDKLMTPELLWQLGRLGESTASHDGNLVAYTVRHYDLSANKGKTNLNLLNLTSKKEITVLDGYSTVNSIQWVNTNEGERLFFIAKENSEADDSAPADPQVWSYDAKNDSTFQVTDIEGGVANLKVSPTGTHLAFTLDIKMDQEVTELYKDLPLADARIIDGLMYRHWNAWHDYKYTHLHVAAINEEGKADAPVDLMEGIYADCPVPPFGGSEQFNWSPDGKEIAYTTKIAADWAESTDSDVYVKQIGSDSVAKNISDGMEGYDNNPSYSPDGKYLAFQSMARAGFEADRNRIMLYDRSNGEITDATQGLDQTAHGTIWTNDSKSIYFTSEHRGTDQVFRVDVGKQGATQVSEGRFNWGLVQLLDDSHALCTKMDMLRPKELSILTLTDKADQVVTHINDKIYADLKLPTIEERWVEATDGKKIHCWVIYPPDFDPNTKEEWPMLTYCQGGPQGQIGQWFSYRWNFHLMAANGYVVLAPNRRGLPGFGREWNDQISGDWGGQAMQDLLSATDDMVKEPYIDSKRVGAIGASFGGYTVYWMMGNHADRFATMIAHCGVFNLESMYGSTEELFFVNWDLGGPYWSSPEVQKKYERFSPHKFVGNWKTPLMVIHGEKDFRVPVTQGMEAFTAAQVKGVPSRFLYFPDEGHWVMGPQNGVLWHRVFFDWLERYCGEQGKQHSPTPKLP